MESTVIIKDKDNLTLAILKNFNNSNNNNKNSNNNLYNNNNNSNLCNNSKNNNSKISCKFLNKKIKVLKTQLLIPQKSMFIKR